MAEKEVKEKEKDAAAEEKPAGEEAPQGEQTQTGNDTDAVSTASTGEEPRKKPSSRTAPPLPEGALWIWGTGRRKTSVARVRIRPGTGTFIINNREKDEYLLSELTRNKAVEPLEIVGMMGSYDVYVNVKGGGVTGQADAISLGLARALSKHVPGEEHALRDKGLLTRDSRAKERKKPGKPGARKSFQYSKR